MVAYFLFGSRVILIGDVFLGWGREMEWTDERDVMMDGFMAASRLAGWACVFCTFFFGRTWNFLYPVISSMMFSK